MRALGLDRRADVVVGQHAVQLLWREPLRQEREHGAPGFLLGRERVEEDAAVVSPSLRQTAACSPTTLGAALLQVR